MDVAHTYSTCGMHQVGAYHNDEVFLKRQGDQVVPQEPRVSPGADVKNLSTLGLLGLLGYQQKQKDGRRCLWVLVQEKDREGQEWGWKVMEGSLFFLPVSGAGSMETLRSNFLHGTLPLPLTLA